MNMHQSNPFERLWSLGYHRLVPVVPPDAIISETSSLGHRSSDPRGKAPGVKNEAGFWHGMNFVAHESELSDLPKWHAMGASVGIKCGGGLALIDADTLDQNLATLIAERVEHFCGRLPLRIGNAPKAGYLVRVDGEFRYSYVGFGDIDDKGKPRERVEILYEGKQFVALGIHPKTGKPYQWPDGVPSLEDVPTVPAGVLFALLDDLAQRLPSAKPVNTTGGNGPAPEQSALKGDLDLVRKAVRATPNTPDLFPDREDYVDYGYALKAALQDHPDEALDLFHEWCTAYHRDSDGDSNDPDNVDADWRRMKGPYRRGASWLYSMATAHGDGSFRDVDRWADTDGSMDLSKIDLNAFKSAAEQNGERRFKLVPFDVAAGAALEESAEPLVEGLLDQGAMTVLYGESNAGKTFVALDINYHIARAMAWGGMDVTGGRVVYIAAEGGLGIRKRAAALRAALGDAGERFLFLIHPINLLRADADLEPLLGTLRDLMADGEGLAMITVDTLSRAMAGGEENGSTDMGAIVKNMDRLRAATLAHLLVVHHSGKDRAKGARGHSLLRAATDTEIEVADGAITVTKQRDIEARWSSGFRIESRDIGLDRKGRTVASGVLRLVSGEAGDAADLSTATARERDVIEAIDALDGMQGEGKEGVPVADLVAYFDAARDKLSAPNLRFYLSAMLSKKLLEKAGRGKYRVKRQFVPSNKLVTDSVSVSECEKVVREKVASLLD